MTVCILDGFAEWAGYSPLISFPAVVFIGWRTLLPNRPAADNSPAHALWQATRLL